MHFPLGLKVSQPGVKLICKLNRSLYGTKQAPRSGQSLLSSWLESYGFSQSKTNPSLYTMIHDEYLFALAVFVDDCLLVGKRSNFLTLFKCDFSSRFKIEDLGPGAWISDSIITRDRARGNLHLFQTQYLKDVLQEFGMSECTSVSSPMVAKVSKFVLVALDIREMPYAKLLYASNCTRLDVTASVNYLSRYMSHPSVEQWLQAKRLLSYLKGTIDKGLVINWTIPYTPVVCQDSSFADRPDGKSRIGYVVLMCGSAIAWGSRLQPTIALSTMEAEYMALCVATQEVMFLKQLSTELSVVLKYPTSMMEDNKGCISFAKNTMTTNKSKHINMKMHIVRDAIRDKIIVLQWWSTHDMIACILTKFSLPAHKHSRLALRMMSGNILMSTAMVQ